MLDQFYRYLSDKVIEFFKKYSLNSGAKYNIQFENENEVKKLYLSLKDNTLCEEFNYKDDNNEIKYRSYQLKFGDVYLIVASTVSEQGEKIQPDFLTRLRNLVGVEEDYKDKAILFIHDTTLDSIVGGTESFTKEGMPFNLNSIQKDIQTKMIDKNFSEVDKAIINMDLERKRKELIGDSISIFEYKDLLAIINSSCIQKEEYKNFGIFFDSELKEFKGKKLKNRLEENALNFNRINEIHSYGNPEIQLEKYYDDKGVEDLKKDDWKEIEYSKVKKYVDGKVNTPPIEYVSSSVDWDREEGNTKAKSRIRNMIIFNEEQKDIIQLEFTFDGYIEKEYIKHNADIESTSSGKKIKAKLKNCSNGTRFFKIVYKNDKNVKFEFRIVVVSFNEKYLESIKTTFSIICEKKYACIRVNTNDNRVTFNGFEENQQKYYLNDNYSTINISDNVNLTVQVGDHFEYEDDNDAIKFKASINESIVPFEMLGTNEKSSPIGGFSVWKLKREDKSDFKLIGENKLYHGTKEYFTRDEFRKSLNLEKEIINSQGISFEDYGEGLESIELNIDENIKIAYYNIISYFRNNNQLPSLTYLNGELRTLFEQFIKLYKERLENIEEGTYISNAEKDLLKIGVIKRNIEDREILLSPLHPLNIVYQLLLNDVLKDEKVKGEILKKFNDTYLVPFFSIEESKVFIPIEQNHSPEWKYYVDEKLPRYKSSRDFVSKLVYEKIYEFVEHFKYLFDLGNNAPIKINLINTGDSKEILQGIFKYYIYALKNDNASILPMDIYVYSNKSITNAFEEVAFNDKIKDLKNLYNLNLNVDSMGEEDVLNLYREKVNFYSRKIEEGIQYAHITFIEMNNEAIINNTKMNDIPSGIIFNGLISGIPSVFTGDYFRTGFGMKFTDFSNDLIKITSKINAIIAATNGDPYDSNHSKVFSISKNNKSKLDEVYNSSHWVTFIDPKVDLNFFKNDPETKDLLIIHYSDQYTTAGGYDAITVTRKCGPYQNVIGEFLQTKGIKNVSKYLSSVINMFNAINGDWLLKLISNKSNMPKEKISILSAIKLSLAKLKKDNFIWVPISLEEVLRVSGGAGLKQSDGLLSARKLGFEGSTSDDILLIGIEIRGNNTIVHYYPIEVKISYRDNNELPKAIEQAKSTKKIFNEIFMPKYDNKLSITQRVYRNFLMQLVITSAEKLNLYDVYEEEQWEKIFNSDVRKQLLNEEYYVSNGLDEDLGEAGVITFKAGNSGKAIYSKVDNIMIMDMNEDDGFNFITQSIEEIRNSVGLFKYENRDRDNCCYCKNVNTKKEDNINDKQFEEEIINEEVLDNKVLKHNFMIHENTSNNKKEEVVNVNDKEVSCEERSMKIVLGTNQRNNGLVYWCPNDTNKLLHTNTGIIGTMGTGKTQFTKSMITQIYKESKYNVAGEKVGILIFDYKGDYNKSKQDFIDATNAKVFELYHLPFNPLSIVKKENSKPMLPLHTASTLKETLAKAFNLGTKQENLLKDLIMEAYEKKGIIKNSSETWNRVAPTFKDVYDVYMSHEEIKKDDSLYAAFSNLIDFEIFEPKGEETKGLFELIDGVTVIDLSGYDSGIQNLVVAITLDLFYSQMQAYGHSKIDNNLRQINKFILVDEADNFLSKNFNSLKKILKEGREFGVGTILSTQLLSHFSTTENDYANYILTWVIHRVDDLNNRDVKNIFNTRSKNEEENLFNQIKKLDKHYSYLKMGNSDRPVFIKDLAFWEICK